MGKSFYIESIKCVSTKGVESKLNFIDGFNLIHGPSNTGKTLIIRCIDYMFGSNKIEGLDNQEYIEMIIRNRMGVLLLKRYICTNRSKVLVSSTIPDIKSGEYSISPGTKNKLSDVFLRLFGVKESPIRIINNADFKTQQLSLRTFIHIFLLKESEIIREESILNPKSNTAKTAFLSALIFLLNGKNQDIFEKEESPEMIKLKNQAVKLYVNKKLKEISEYESHISDSMIGISKEEAENNLKEALKKVNYNNTELSALTEENKNLLKSNIALTREKEENKVSLKNFEDLIKQYNIDENRLYMLLESQPHIHENKIETSCPFCDSKIESNISLKNMDCIYTELKNIEIKSHDLNETLKFLNDKDLKLSNEINANSAKISENSKHINEIINPSLENLLKTINEYKTFFSLQAEKETLNKLSLNWNSDLNELDDKNIEKNTYKPLERFPNNFFSEMSDILRNLLEMCSFPNLSSARFDKFTFDADINGKSKASQGKGYRAFLNSIVALCMLDYLYRNAVYSIPIFIADTPLLGLDEIIVSENISAENMGQMRSSLYKYLVDIGRNMQVIIIDNNKDLPDYIFDISDINAIEFTKSKTKGRYGFLERMYD